jgi:hypothetical protein
MKLKVLAVSLLLVLLPVLARSQSQLPGPISGGSRAAPFEGETPTNLLILGMGVSGSYDDNAFSTIPAGPDQVVYTFLPRVAWNFSRHHWDSALDYQALVARSSKLDFYNRTSHDLRARLGRQLTRRLSFSVYDNFRRYTDAQLQYQESAVVPGSGVLEAPNTSFLGVPTLRTSEQVGADVQYLLSARSSIGVGGAFGLERYQSLIGPSSPQRDSNTASAHGYYRRALSARRSLGLMYDFQKITSAGGYSTISHRAMLYHDFLFRPTMKLSLFAGPERLSTSLPLSTTPPIVLFSSGWSWSAGGTFSWAGPRTGVSVGVVRQTSDGGGLSGAVQLTNSFVNLRRQLGRKWTAGVNMAYNLNNRPLGNPGTALTARYGSGGASLTWAPRRDLSVVVSYTRFEQSRLVGLSNQWVDRNQATISVNYSFMHPLGR